MDNKYGLGSSKVATEIHKKIKIMNVNFVITKA
jgi:hypothetical protein